MMGKLIDTDDLKRDLIERGFYPVFVKSALEQIPEAVVRCKDCKHVSVDAYWGGYYCEGKLKKADDFCNYGERRGDE